ncbi:hypothetical protein FRC04_006877 [Tulasnella sp. 424]|nr:hypothetical protein FRC04_006877 [Tulasnella sp. 424]KAG8974382.1 hypothetical protein FRC05_007543 [Tulasnella sp. 425]
MSFFFRPAFYQERPAYSSPRSAVSDDEAYYRHVAEEHQRRARAALALAQKEERGRRQAASQRLYHEEPHFRSEYRPDYIPTRPTYAQGPLDFPFDAYESQLPPRCEHLPDVSQRSRSPTPRSRGQAIQDDHERRIEEWLQRRRQRELEEVEFRRWKELERRRDDELIRELLAAFGIDSLRRKRAAPVATSSPRLTRMAFEEELDPTSTAPRQVPTTNSQPCECGQHIPSPQPVQASEPASAPSTSPSSDFATQLWNALSGGRSDKERASILRDLGLNIRFNVTLTPNTHHTAAEQRPIPAQRSTAAPRPTARKPQAQPSSPALVPFPVLVRSPAPATPQPKPSTSRNPSPAPVKQSPFTHIESIQTKFDSLRASTPDLSEHQKKREYLAELNKLLTPLDAVESSGSESIRGARKALVRAVEDQLEKVEGSQDVEKHEAYGDQHAEEVKVEVKLEERPSIAEAAPEPQASAQSVAEEVEIKSVSDSEPIQLYSIEPTTEEPANAASQPLSTELETSSQPVSTEGETHPEVPTTTPDMTVSTSEDGAESEVDAGDEKVHGAGQDNKKQPERGRQPIVSNQDSKCTRTRRPPSVEVEEVPDEERLSGSSQVGYKDL